MDGFEFDRLLNLEVSSTTSRMARRELYAFLESVEATAIAPEAATVLGELVANAIDHGRPVDGNVIEVRFGWDPTGHLWISVLDGGGPTTPVVVTPDPEAVRGRGLAMVAGLSTDWSVERDHGTRVTARLAVDRDSVH